MVYLGKLLSAGTLHLLPPDPMFDDDVNLKGGWACYKRVIHVYICGTHLVVIICIFYVNRKTNMY